MLNSPFDVEMLNTLKYWIKERESIRIKKEAGKKPPWTKNKVLSTYRFCNVRRMDDKVSVWLYDNWYNPNRGHKNMLVACALARLINSIETLEAIGFPKKWNPDKIKLVVRKRTEEGHTIYNPAYMIRGGGAPDKIGMVVDHYVGPLLIYPPEVNTDSMEETWNSIFSRFGFGSFMAGQVVADLRWAMQGNWKDKDSWAPIGPGSKRGMNRLLGRELKLSMRQEVFLSKLRTLIKCLKEDKTLKSIVSNMEAMDYQNCLCEFDKFRRATTGQGKPKQKYDWKVYLK